MATRKPPAKKTATKKTPTKKAAAKKTAKTVEKQAVSPKVDDVITIKLDADWNLKELTRHLPDTDGSDTIGGITLERVLDGKNEERIKIYYMVLEETDDSFTVDISRDEGSRGVVSVRPKELKPFVTLFINRITGFCEVSIPDDAPVEIDQWKLKLTVQRIKHTVVH